MQVSYFAQLTHYLRTVFLPNNGDAHSSDSFGPFRRHFLPVGPGDAQGNCLLGTLRTAQERYPAAMSISNAVDAAKDVVCLVGMIF